MFLEPGKNRQKRDLAAAFEKMFELFKDINQIFLGTGEKP